MHILICDDDAVFAARVETLVRDFFALRGLQVDAPSATAGKRHWPGGTLICIRWRCWMWIWTP